MPQDGSIPTGYRISFSVQLHPRSRKRLTFHYDRHTSCVAAHQQGLHWPRCRAPTSSPRDHLGSQFKPFGALRPPLGQRHSYVRGAYNLVGSAFLLEARTVSNGGCRQRSLRGPYKTPIAWFGGTFRSLPNQTVWKLCPLAIGKASCKPS